MLKSKKKNELQKMKQSIEKSGLFDKVYYLKNNHDVRVADLTPIEHYCQIGIKEDRKPNSQFDPEWYCNFYMDVVENQISAVEDFIMHGESENRFINSIEQAAHKIITDSGLFDEIYYLALCPDLVAHKNANRDMLLHFIRNGSDENRNPNSDFDTEWYRSHYSDLTKSSINPLVHYALYGQKEGRFINSSSYEIDIEMRKKAVEEELRIQQSLLQHEFQKKVAELQNYILDSELFDSSYYLNAYLDVLESGMDPLKHFCEFGLQENRKPNADFDPVWYREYYQELIEDDIHPFIHYILYGLRENKYQNELEKNEYENFKNSDFDVDFYKIYHDDLAKIDYERFDFLLHYIRYGRFEGREISYTKKDDNDIELEKKEKIIQNSNLFDKQFYYQQLEQRKEKLADISPIRHYLAEGWKKGFNPNEWFDIKKYLLANKDLADAQIEPFVHYIEYGQYENRPFETYEFKEIIEKNKYVEYTDHAKSEFQAKVIAFYLPQFHPFPENDAWWGKGFTEWTNVTKAQPNFMGHYQPHLPIHNGFYDLRVPEVMMEQAKLAKNYGIQGFNFYYYWFDGKVLMHRPFEILLEHKEIDIEFCITWANENWSRRWDGAEHDVLIGQNHCEADSIAFLENLYPFFRDERYIRINNKPVLIIYRADIIPQMKETVELWRNKAAQDGFDGLYLICSQTFGISSPEPFGFDAAMEFPPHTAIATPITDKIKVTNASYEGVIYDYSQVVANACRSREPEYKLFRTCMLSWDNTARQQNSSHIFYNFSLNKYREWLFNNVSKIAENDKYSEDEKLVFVNAWNEWAEGTHLEPDREYGYGYLQATYDVVKKYEIELVKSKSKHYDLVVFASTEEKESFDQLINTLEWFKNRTFLKIGVALEGKHGEIGKLKSVCEEVYFFDDIDGHVVDIKQYFKNKIKSLYVHNLDNKSIIDQLENLHIPVICNVDGFGDFDTFNKNIVYISKDNKYQNSSVVKCLSESDTFELNLLELLYDFTDLNPKVSVIIPSYNHEPFLEQRLQSILNQTFQDFELILLDDVSKDNTQQVLKAYTEKRPSSFTYFNTTNSGTPFSQWAKGMKIARADIIWIAEDDDFCENNFLEKLVPLFFNSRIKMAYSNSHLIDESNNIIGRYEDIFSKISTNKWNKNYIAHAYEEVYTSLAIRNTIPNASAVLFRKFDIENILEELKTFKFAGDWYFYLNVLSSGDIGYVSDKLNYHRRHSTSTMSILKDDVKLYFGEIEKIHKFVRNNFLLTDQAIDKTIEYIQDEWLYKQRNDRLDEYYGIEDLKNSKKTIKRIQNIAVFFSGYYFGGAEIYPINLANAFAELGHNAFLFDVGSLDTDEKVKAMVSPLVHKCDIKGTKNSQQDLKDFLEKNKIDVINTQGWFATDFMQKSLIWNIHYIPWFASMHGHEENIIEGAWGKEYLQYFEHAMKNTIAKAPKFIYTHEKNLEVFEYFPINEQCKLIGIPTLGMDATLPESNLKSELNIDKDSFVLGFVARGIEEKGWTEVIESAKILRENYKVKVDLVLIGDSEFVQTLKEQNKNFGYIHFLGYSDEVLSWGQIFDVSLLPSFYKSESHPLVIMGYLLCSNPVITTPLGNIPKMIEYNGEQAGYLLQFTQQYRTDPKEIAEIISNYIKDPSLYKQHRAVARKAFEKFDMKVAASKYVDVFNRYSKI